MAIEVYIHLAGESNGEESERKRNAKVLIMFREQEAILGAILHNVAYALGENPSFFAYVLGKSSTFAPSEPKEKEMIYRELMEQLQTWSEKENRKPLVLRGARQVGKVAPSLLFLGIS